MQEGGWSDIRLERLHRVMSGYIERGEVPGLVLLLSRYGAVHTEVLGCAARENRAPMQRDTLFRIASMTKPVTAVAAMILIEECVLRLDEPVDRWLPELANRRVLRRIDGPLEDTAPARRAITLRDLLTMRLGLGLANVFAASGSSPIDKAIEELQLVGFGPPNPAAPLSPDEWLRRLGTLPLMAQPGERWLYNIGSYVLGVLIARASGQPLERFMRERIFEPLGMTDTAFSVPPEKLHRLAAGYGPNARTGALDLLDDAHHSAWSQAPAFPDGGAGLVSTIDDYHAFAQMLLLQGQAPEARLLSRLSVQTMVTDQLTPAQKAISGLVPGQFDHRGWGFGVGVVTARDDLYAVPGRYGWDGGYGTSWWSDPDEDLIAILMTQRAGFPQHSSVYLDFWTSVYQAIDD
ncbi:MAG TPA: serine hydrolase domain-containing protein [Steroidobacteraceae bacterium]